MPSRFIRRVPLRLLAFVSALALPVLTLDAQFVQQTHIVKDGVRISLLPSATVSHNAAGTVSVTLTNLAATVDRTYGVEVDGRRYDYLAFNGQLTPLFNAIRVNTASLAFTLEGAGTCSRISYASWRVGGVENLSVCGQPTSPRFTGYSINGITTSGVLELQSKVRALVAAEARAAQQAEQQARQQAQQEAQAAAAARAAATAAATKPAAATGTSTAPTATSGGSTASSTSGASAADAERARQQAEADRQAAAAQATLDQIARDNAASQQRLDAATDELAGSVVAVAQVIAQSSRDRQAREARQAAANAAAYQRRMAEYNARITARYAANLGVRRCTTADLVAARVGTPLVDSLTMRTCRTSDDRAMAWVELVNTTPRHVRVSASGFSEMGVLSMAHGPASAWADGSSKGMERTSDFFLAPGAPAHRMMIWTNEKGEIGQYTVNAREWTASAASQSLWFVGLDVSSSANTIGGYEESLFGGRFEGGLHIGNGILLAGHVGLDGENYNFGFNAQYVMGSDNHRFRPFIRLDPWTAVYGTTTYGFSNDIGYEGFTYGFGAGLMFFPSLRSNDLAITLEWGMTSGSMFDDTATDRDFSQSGFRLGYRAFGFAKPR